MKRAESSVCMTSSRAEWFSLVRSPSSCFCPSAFPGQSSPAGGNLSEVCVMFHPQAFWVIGQWHSSSSISGLRPDDYNCSLSLRDIPAWPSFSQHDSAFGGTKTQRRSGRVDPRGGAPQVSAGRDLQQSSAAWQLKLDCDVWSVLASRAPSHVQCLRSLVVWILHVGLIRKRRRKAQAAERLFGLFFYGAICAAGGTAQWGFVCY